MHSTRNLVVNIGLDRLFQEIIGAALSNYGWRVVDLENGPLPSDCQVEIVLVAASDTPEIVINRVRRARGQFPAGKVVLLGAEGTDADFVRFIEAGANAYVSGRKGLADLLESLQMVRNNRTPSSGRVTKLVLNTIRQLSCAPNTPPEAPLTSREEEILHFIWDGLSNKEIASRLSITPNTVKNHVHNLLEKLKVRSRHEAAWKQPRPQGFSRTVRAVGDRVGGRVPGSG
ncbi:MAG: response regulator transcription factor [Candidatus Sulfotelmatobacter sp.]